MKFRFMHRHTRDESSSMYMQIYIHIYIHFEFWRLRNCVWKVTECPRAAVLAAQKAPF